MLAGPNDGEGTAMMRSLRRGMVTAVLGVISACGGQPGTPANHDGNRGGSGNAAAAGAQSVGAGGSGNGAAGAGAVGSSAGGSAGTSAVNGASGGMSAGGVGARSAGAGAGGSPSGAGTAGASAGGASGSGALGMAGLSAGAGGGGNGGDNTGGHAASGGTSSSVDCTGTFGDGQVLVAGAKQVILSSPTAPADELELFFVEHDVSKGGSPRIMRMARATSDASFGDAAPVTELDSVCNTSDERGISITPDGLRLYVDCYTGTSSFTPGPVHLAQRTARDASFMIDSATYGTIGPQIDVTADELTAFTSSEMNTTSPPRQYSRSSTSDPFANGQAIPGLESVALGTPFLASDGLTLYGGVDPDLVFVARPAPGQPFGSPSVVFAGQKNMAAYRAPEVSADCRTLYFVRIDTASGASTYSLEVSKR
jgi:hypothetical protein